LLIIHGHPEWALIIFLKGEIGKWFWLAYDKLKDAGLRKPLGMGERVVVEENPRIGGDSDIPRRIVERNQHLKLAIEKRRVRAHIGIDLSAPIHPINDRNHQNE
jgi:hypothetical protein